MAFDFAREAAIIDAMITLTRRRRALDREYAALKDACDHRARDGSSAISVDPDGVLAPWCHTCSRIVEEPDGL